MPAMSDRDRLRGRGPARRASSGEERESRARPCSSGSPTTAPTLEELRDAVEDGRLALLPLERMLAGAAALHAGRGRRALRGPDRRARAPVALDRASPCPNRDEIVLSREDLDAAHRMRAILDAGLGARAARRARPHDRRRDVAVRRRLAGRSSAATFIGDGGDRGRGLRSGRRGCRGLIPPVGPTLDYVYRLHLREQLRHAAFDEAGESRTVERPARRGDDRVGFADLVGFTKLGEQLPPEELGRVTGRLEEVAREVAHGPVRLVKLIGDAAMLASADTDGAARGDARARRRRWPRRRTRTSR